MDIAFVVLLERHTKWATRPEGHTIALWWHARAGRFRAWGVTERARGIRWLTPVLAQVLLAMVPLRWHSPLAFSVIPKP